jgi:lipid-A-disaccharide synthase
MSTTKTNIMIIAGEISGDIHGAALIHEIRKLDNSIEVFGIGGNLMKNQGAYLLYHLNRMAFLGFVEVVKHIPFVKQVQAELTDMVHGRNIKTIILIDYPGFNLNLAEKLRSLDVKIVYYISPQIWAWGQNRIKKIQRLVDKMIVVFSFEKEIYQKAGVNVEYVGHPLTENIADYKFLDRAEFFKNYELDPSKEILLLMPGSRKQEVEKIFPESMKAADKLANEFNLQIVVGASENIGERFLKNLTRKRNFKIIKNRTYDLMKYSKFGIIKSGTSTLEAAIFQLPMIIVYKTSGLTYFIGKKLIKVKNIGMANILLNEQVVPELIQQSVNQKTIYEKCKAILSDEQTFNSMKEKLGSVKGKLGDRGASEKAAKIIFELMNDIKKS